MINIIEKKMLKVRPSFSILLNRYGDKEALVCAEIGVLDGDNAEAMLEKAPNIYLYLIDPYLASKDYPDQEEMDLKFINLNKRLERFSGRYEILRETSEKASETFEDGMFDYVYIDGDHSYDAVQLDLECWDKKVKFQGMIAGHDYPIVKKAVIDMYCQLRRVIYYCGHITPKVIPYEYNDWLDWFIYKEEFKENGLEKGT